MLKISVVGCGAIGSSLIEAIVHNFKEKAELVGLYDLDKQKIETLCSRLKIRPKVLPFEELIPISDLIIEAATKDIVPELVKKCLLNNKSIMVISIGGFVHQEHLFEMAQKSQGRLYLPSGALCALDALKAANEAKIEKVELTTRKPPKGLKGAPYLKDNNIDLSKIDKETTVFSGSAKDAIEGFPKNVNVAALLSVAGIGFDKTSVKILTSPKFRTNSHQVIIEGDFGRLEARTDNVASPQNPKTSYLAVLSCMATLRQILSNVKIGT